MSEELEKALSKLADVVAENQKLTAQLVKTSADQSKILDRIASGQAVTSEIITGNRIAKSKEEFETIKKDKVATARQKIAGLRKDKADLLDKSEFEKAEGIEGKIDDLKDEILDVRSMQFEEPAPDNGSGADDTVADPDVDDFIDSITWMKGTDAKSIKMQEDAYAFDKRLSTAPEFKNKPTAERLAKVKEMVETEHKFEPDAGAGAEGGGEAGGGAEKGGQTSFEKTMRAGMGLDEKPAEGDKGGAT